MTELAEGVECNVGLEIIYNSFLRGSAHTSDSTQVQPCSVFTVYTNQLKSSLRSIFAEFDSDGGRHGIRLPYCGCCERE